MYKNLKEKLQKRFVLNIKSGQSEEDSKSESRGSEQLDLLDILGISGKARDKTKFTPKSGGISKNWKKLRAYVFTAFKKQKMDMIFLSRVVNMQDKLENILGEPGNKNIGQKYREIKRNIWDNPYNRNTNNQSSANFSNPNHLFQVHTETLKFYDHAKQRKLIRDGD